MKPAEREAKKAELIAKFREIAAREMSVPGVRRFVSETGAKKHLFAGTVWPSWGAFLVEAGFAPNEPGLVDVREALAAAPQKARCASRSPRAARHPFAIGRGDRSERAVDRIVESVRHDPS